MLGVRRGREGSGVLVEATRCWLKQEYSLHLDGMKNSVAHTQGEARPCDAKGQKRAVRWEVPVSTATQALAWGCRDLAALSE